MFRTREGLNVFALLMLLLSFISLIFILADIEHLPQLSFRQFTLPLVLASPFVALAVTGQMFVAAFFSTLCLGSRNPASQGYSRERSWARAGQGRDAALGLIWRHRMVGDVPGLWAVLEMARYDENMKEEAVLAANLLFKTRLSQADRDHVGRTLQLVKISTAKAHYKWD